MLNYSDKDFIGFSFDDHHFEGFNVIRVSDGDRYHEILSPNFQDKTLAVNGVDETYYFYTNFTQRPISVTIAFDKVTDSDIRSLRRVLYPKATGALKFDETPFKQYQVKVQSPPQLDYICFLENGKRVYKGEGTIQFVAYYPYGICTKKYLEEYGSTAVEPDWNAQAGLLATKRYQPVPEDVPILLDDFGETGEVTNLSVYNAGDIPADYILTFKCGVVGEYQILLSNQAFNQIVLQFTPIANTVYQLDTRSHLLLSQNTLANSIIDGGVFTKIPISVSGSEVFTFSAKIYNTNSGWIPTNNLKFTSITYNYLYL